MASPRRRVEIRRGVETMRHRGDARQANQLEAWLTAVLKDFGDNILDFSHDEAQVWGRLRVPHLLGGGVTLAYCPKSRISTPFRGIALPQLPPDLPPRYIR